MPHKRNRRSLVRSAHLDGIKKSRNDDDELAVLRKRRDYFGNDAFRTITLIKVRAIKPAEVNDK